MYFDSGAAPATVMQILTLSGNAKPDTGLEQTTDDKAEGFVWACLRIGFFSFGERSPVLFLALVFPSLNRPFF